MNKDAKLDIKSLLAKLTETGQKLRRYSLIAFVVFVAAIYSFVLFRINSLENTQPSADAVSNQVKAAQVPHIDQAVVRQLQTLQDHSVSVQTLFDQARSNPFQ